LCVCEGESGDRGLGDCTSNILLE